MGAAIRRNHNPGSGSYEHISMKTHTFNAMHRGQIEPHYADDKCPPVLDNGVPGPGTYDGKDQLPIPNFKICQPSPVSKQYQLWQENTGIK